MKKLLIALLVVGTAMSSMAQMLAVFDVKTKGAVLLEDESDMVIGKGRLVGWLIMPVDEGEYQGGAVFVEAEKGWYEQLECTVMFNAFSNDSVKGATKSVEKGVVVLSFSVGTEIDGMGSAELVNATLGKFVYMETAEQRTFNMVTKGAGVIALDEMIFPGYVSGVKTKVNKKLTQGANESEDAEAFLEEALSEKVKTEVDLDFSVFF